MNARFLIWAFALTIPLAAYEISKSKRLLCFSILIFLFVFVSNFPKMARTYHPDLDLRLIYKIDKRCDLRGYDKSFLRYNIWLKEFSGISAFIQYLSRNFRDRLKIKCVGEDMKEIWCPFLLYGEVKDGKMNDVSSCLREVKDPDLVVVIHIYRAREPEHIRSDEEYALLFPGFQRIYSLLNTTARGAAVNYEVLMKGDLIAELHEKIDFWKTNCSELFKN